MNTSYQKNINCCIKWINTQMLTFDNGYYGIYERIRIDEHIRTNWSRPDCNTEYLRVLMLHRETTGDNSNDILIENIINWLIKAQDTDPMSIWNGSFPFYVVDGYIRENKTDATIYQNDNGKILTIMCQLYKRYGDERFLTIAKGVADYWCRIQHQDGTFGVKDSRNMYMCAKGPCFVHWLATGLCLLYDLTKNQFYMDSAEKALDYIKITIEPSGRSKTSFEIIQMEDWRPVSSETAMAFHCFCIAYQVTKNKVYLDYLNLTGDFIIQLQDKSGAIKNCDDSCMDCTPQTNSNLADLAYTQGFALQALTLAYQLTADDRWLKSAKRLADFLSSVQCKDESPLWDGGWRGSYNIVTQQWDGRANQNNLIDEGGLYSVYTGWCCCNIMYGMQLLMSIEDTIASQIQP